VLAYEVSGYIIANDVKSLAFAALAFIGCVIIVAILNSWRHGVYFFLGWLLFEDFARKYLGNNMAIYFAEDILLAVVYLSFFAAYRRKEKHLEVMRPPFLMAIMIFVWFGVLQMFNPASTSIFYGILGMKLYFYYMPLFFLGYAFMDSEADLRRFFHPLLPGEHGDAHRDTKECLCHRSMGARNRGRKEEKNCKTAENPLHNDRAERCHTQHTQPAALFGAPGPNCQNNREQTDELGHHAMPVLEFHTADHVRHLVKGTEGGGPIRHGESGVIAGDQGPGDDKQKSHAGREDGEGVKSAIVRCGNDLQTVLLGSREPRVISKKPPRVSHC